MSSLETLVLPLSSNLTLIAIMCLVIWYYWTNRKLIALASRLPTIPLLSPLYFLIMGGKGFSNYTNQMVKEFMNSGAEAVVFWLGPVPYYFFLTKPDDIQTVLNSCSTVGTDMDTFKYFLGNSLPTAPRDIWRVTRRHYQSVFHPRNVDLLMPELNQCGRDLALDLSRHVGSTPVDLREDISRSMFMAVCYLIFGPEFKASFTSVTLKRFIRSMSRINDLMTLRMLRLWLRSDIFFERCYSEELKDIESNFEEFLSSIKVDTDGHGLGERTVNDSCDGKSREEDKRGSLHYKRIQDAFETMRENYSIFTPKSLKEEIISTLLVGSESTTLTVLYTVLALAAHPDIQEAAYAEISATGRSDGDVTIEDLKAMTYLDQVVKETLRLFPVVPTVSRQLDRETKLSFGTLPAGVTVVTSSAGLHYNPQFYPDPDRFDPDRFTPENVAKRPKCTYLPFMAGPRNCIGKYFALVEAKTNLVHLIRRFKFTTSVNINNIEYIFGLSYRPADLLPVELTFRN